jgi:hypothetical protein
MHAIKERNNPLPVTADREIVTSRLVECAARSGVGSVY